MKNAPDLAFDHSSDDRYADPLTHQAPGIAGIAAGQESLAKMSTTGIRKQRQTIESLLDRRSGTRHQPSRQIQRHQARGKSHVSPSPHHPYAPRPAAEPVPFHRGAAARQPPPSSLPLEPSHSPLEPTPPPHDLGGPRPPRHPAPAHSVRQKHAWRSTYRPITGEGFGDPGPVRLRLTNRAPLVGGVGGGGKGSVPPLTRLPARTP